MRRSGRAAGSGSRGDRRSIVRGLGSNYSARLLRRHPPHVPCFPRRSRGRKLKLSRGRRLSRLQIAFSYRQMVYSAPPRTTRGEFQRVPPRRRAVSWPEGVSAARDNGVLRCDAKDSRLTNPFFRLIVRQLVAGFRITRDARNMLILRR